MAVCTYVVVDLWYLNSEVFVVDFICSRLVRPRRVKNIFLVTLLIFLNILSATKGLFFFFSFALDRAGAALDWKCNCFSSFCLRKQFCAYVSESFLDGDIQYHSELIGVQQLLC